MQRDELRALLTALKSGERSLDEVEAKLAQLPYEDIGFARIDHHRDLRTAAPEVIFAPGKTDAQLADIFCRMATEGRLVMATRVEPERMPAVQRDLPQELQARVQFDPVSRILWAGEPRPAGGRGTVAVVSAGTSDIPVAEEAARTLELLGNTVDRIWDVGVAGLHRVLSVRDRIAKAEIAVVAAGMEGALFSVVKGLVPRPVIAVPTRVGGGFDGLAALLAGLHACAPGVVVVGVDNGFGAGYAAHMFNRDGGEG
jgi:NCAIR mutase (PurE)-related protein